MPAPRLFERRDDDLWTPEPRSRGPHLGVQGGISAGLMCAVAEEATGPEFSPSSISVQFIRTVPLETLRTSCTIIHKGRRSAVCDTAIWTAEKLLARATVTLTTTIDIPAVPEPTPQSTDPSSFTLLAPYRSAHGQPWHDEILEKASAPDGSYWYRSPWRITGFESPFAAALPFADWSPGLARLDDWQAPLLSAFPNIEFTAHADRQPQSEWIGVRPHARWRRSGIGLVSTRLFDLAGDFGRFSSTLVLLPRDQQSVGAASGRDSNVAG